MIKTSYFYAIYRMIKVSVHLTITVQNNPHTIDELKVVITEYIRNVDRAILNTVFENTVRRVNKRWRLAGYTLNITCNFLYCNHQVHRDFLITLYKLFNIITEVRNGFCPSQSIGFTFLANLKTNDKLAATCWCN